MIRIIWRFAADAVPFEDLLGEPPNVIRKWALDDPTAISPVFPGPRESLFEERAALPEKIRDESANDLARYYQTFRENQEAAIPMLTKLAKELAEGRIEWLDLQSDIETDVPSLPLDQDNVIVCPPDPGVLTPAWDDCQVYLGPADSTEQTPSGVDARFAWTLKGGSGKNAQIVDVEIGWDLEHEDLAGQVVKRFGSFDLRSHGTAVLGVLCAKPQDPRLGVLGIAHGAAIGVGAFKDHPGQEPNPEAVVRQACQWLNKGDVLLLELQATRPGVASVGGRKPWLPMEAWEQGRLAIRLAQTKGIHVVEAAGNGGLELSLQEHDVPDSGTAIMVGAGHLVSGHTLGFSNHGPRVDVQGWGREVVTTGAAQDPFQDLQSRPETGRCYTRSFGGTSSASAIVAGCVAVISSVSRAHGFGPLSPAGMKGLLQTTGSFRNRQVNGDIGPLPNLRAALEALEDELKQQHHDFNGFQRL